jgi:hypothetical protein
MKRMRKSLAVMAGLGLALALDGGLALTPLTQARAATHAHASAQAGASTPTGLCISDKTSLCARSNGYLGNVDQWPQDISGDPNQQFNRSYLGQVTSTNGGCWPFTCGNGLNATYNGNSVWAFSSASSSQFLCLYNYSAINTALDQCNFSDPGNMYVWTSVGVLVSVGASDLYGAPQYLNSNANYQPLFTTGNWCTPGQCLDTWVMRNGS